MSELKTLKDISLYRHASANKAALREEAVKWYKNIIEEQKKKGRWIEGSKNNRYAISPRKEGQMSFIKRFFNLTDEELA